MRRAGCVPRASNMPNSRVRSKVAISIVFATPAAAAMKTSTRTSVPARSVHLDEHHHLRRERLPIKNLGVARTSRRRRPRRANTADSSGRRA